MQLSYKKDTKYFLNSIFTKLLYLRPLYRHTLNRKTELLLSLFFCPVLFPAGDISSLIYYKHSLCTLYFCDEFIGIMKMMNDIRLDCTHKQYESNEIATLPSKLSRQRKQKSKLFWMFKVICASQSSKSFWCHLRLW